jgi:dTDP-4-dehydrorhamnose reductase
MMRQLMTKEDVKVVFDQRGTPTWTRNVARAILRIVSTESPIFGLFHYTDGGAASWFEFARAIQEEALAVGLLTCRCTIIPIRADQYGSLALRPAYSVLDTKKIQSGYAISASDWRQCLHTFVEEEVERCVNSKQFS